MYKKILNELYCISKAKCVEPANKIKLIRHRRESSQKFKISGSPIVITTFNGC